MQLLVQPEDGVFPVLKAIQKARRSIDMHIFRLDSKEIEKALAAAVTRGVVVRTLIAHTNARGEKGLRKLEQRLLALGATVSRTADDLVRYHGKMMIVDCELAVRPRLQPHAARHRRQPQPRRRHAQARARAGGPAPVRGGLRPQALHAAERRTSW